MLTSTMIARVFASDGDDAAALIAKLNDGAEGYVCSECKHETNDPLVGLVEPDGGIVFYCPKCNDQIPHDRPAQGDDVMPQSVVARHSGGRGFQIARVDRCAIYLGPWPGVVEPKQVIAIADRDGECYTRIGELYSAEDREVLELVLRGMAGQA